MKTRSCRMFHGVCVALFAALATAQGARAALGWPVAINGYDVPLRVSVAIAAVAVLLAVWAWRTRA